MDSKRVELSVLVPCLNEEANLEELTDRLGTTFQRAGIRAEVILVDDGSADRTWDAIQSLVSKFPFVVGLRHKANLGIPKAWETALKNSQGRLICLFDGDLQYQPEDIPRLLAALQESNVDIVQGWRSPVGWKKQPRYYWSRGLNSILNLLFNLGLKDAKSGFVLCPGEVLQDLLQVRYRYHFWQSFIMAAARAKRYSYQQIEILFEPRRAGTSFLADLPARVMLLVLRDLFPAFVEYRLRSPRRDTTQTFLATKSNQLAAPAPSSDSKAGGSRWWLLKQTFELTHWMMTRDVFQHLDELESSQWLRPDQMRELQNLKLRRLVRHAYRHVPFYRSRMREAGLVPDDIQTIEDLEKLPLVSKEDIRNNLYFDIMSDNHNKREVLKITTSGSTGEPFVCYADKNQLEIRWAATMRSMMWTGWRPGQPQVRLWHQTIGLTHLQTLQEYADAWIMRRRFIPAYEISESSIDSFVRTIEASKPVLLDGYAESFNFIARYLRDRGPLSISPKGIISSAQQLPDSSRQIIEDSFGCRVFDKYGSREFSGIAYECEAHDGHHVVGESYVVEVLKGGRACKPGEIGEVVITDLNNYCLPFIRYRIGDLAEAVDSTAVCSCGRGLPKIGAIEGRVQSVIIGADGQYIPGTFFSHVFKDFDHAVRQYQVSQTQPGEITLRIVPGRRFNQAAIEDVENLLRRYLGHRTVIGTEIVQEIPLVRTGKRLQAISEVALDLQSQDVAVSPSLRG